MSPTGRAVASIRRVGRLGGPSPATGTDGDGLTGRNVSEQEGVGAESAAAAAAAAASRRSRRAFLPLPPPPPPPQSRTWTTVR